MRWMVRGTRGSILAIWLALVAYAVWERWGGAEAPAPAPEGVERSALAAETETWMGVYLQERKIGYTRYRREPAAAGFRFEQESVLRLSILDTTQTVRVSVRGETDAHHALRSFSALLRSAVGDFEASGQVKRDELLLRTEMGGQAADHRIPLSEPIYLPAGARARFGASALKEGERLSFRVFDPSTLQHQVAALIVEARERITVGDATVDAWRVGEELRGMRTTVWIDDDGEVLREEGPLQLVAVRETAEQALSGGWQEAAALDLMSVVAISTKERIPAPRRLRRMEIRLGGISGVTVPTDVRQRFMADRLLVETEGSSGPAYALPYVDEQWRKEIEPTFFLQSDHPRIREAARQALSGETDARQAATRLRRWVYEKLEKKPTVSLPNALQVLEMGAGDCNEHAVLLAALARASGLPARVVAGAVYMDGVFLYHAWNEVWLGSAWVSVDATLDQMPADATHIKLVEGGPEEHDALLQVIGRLSIDVLSYEGEEEEG